MKGILSLLLCVLVISGCDYIGTTKVKKLIDLTTKLEKNSSENVYLATTSVVTNKSKNYYGISQGNIIGTPTVVGDIIYTVDKKGFVAAFSTSKRQKLWQVNITPSALSSFTAGGITHNSGKLYVTNNSRYLVILDAKNGEEIVRKQFPDLLRTKPSIHKNTVIVQTISNQTLAYNKNTLEIMWGHEGTPEAISVSKNVYPIVHKDNVIINYSSGEVVSLNARTGAESWRYYLSELSHNVINPGLNQEILLTAPIIKDNYAYFATSQSQVIKMNLSSGIPEWKIDAEDVQSMQIIGNNLFITNNARQIAALSKVNGSVKWTGDLISEFYKKAKKAKPTTFQKPFLSSEAEGDAINVIGANGELYKFIQDKSGKLPSKPKIIAIKKHVSHYFIGNDNNLYLVIRNFLRF